MNLLLLEIVHRILEYDGRIKYRHGKYMNQIAQDDDRYKMLQTMPRPCSYYIFQNLYMTISGGKICCKKSNASYTALDYYGEKTTHLIVTQSNTLLVSYICISQGFQYDFVIYKTPSLFSYITEYLYDLCSKFIYNYCYIRA